MMIRFSGIFILLFFIISVFAQQTAKTADSLLKELYQGKNTNREEAISQCTELVSYYVATGDTCNQIKALTKRGSFERASAQYKKSLTSLIEAQRLYENSTCDIHARILILLSYASLYESLYEFDKADSLALLGIRLYDHSNPDKTSLIRLYMTATGGLLSLENSLPYLDTAYRLALEYEKLDFQEEILINKGVAYANNDNFPEALKYMQQAIPLAKKRKDLGTLGSLYNNLAGLSEDPDVILMFVDSALYYANLSNNLTDIQLYTENKAYFYSTIGNYEDGYYELWESMVMKDTLLNIKKLEAIAEMEQKYEAEKKSNEIQTLKVENLNTEVENLIYRRNQNILYVGLIVMLMLALFLAIAFISIRRHRNSLAIKNVEIDKARQLSDELLLNILPSEIAKELKEKGTAEARKFESVSILFTDFKEFTQTSEKLTATELVSKINYCFESFDAIMDKYGIEKIKTIGDAYMSAGGLPVHTNYAVRNTVLAGLEMQAFILNRKKELETTDEPAFEMRVGIHTGPVVAGIVGVKKFQYDLWGDTVNTASRMETNGREGKVNISGDTYEIIKDDSDFVFESRGKILVKGKGEIDMYFVSLV